MRKLLISMFVLSISTTAFGAEIGESAIFELRLDSRSNTISPEIAASINKFFPKPLRIEKKDDHLTIGPVEEMAAFIEGAIKDGKVRFTYKEEIWGGSPPLPIKFEGRVISEGRIVGTAKIGTDIIKAQIVQFQSYQSTWCCGNHGNEGGKCPEARHCVDDPAMAPVIEKCGACGGWTRMDGDYSEFEPFNLDW